MPTDYGGKGGSVAEHWGESKDHEKHEIVNLYSRLISIRIANYTIEANYVGHT